MRALAHPSPGQHEHRQARRPSGCPRDATRRATMIKHRGHTASYSRRFPRSWCIRPDLTGTTWRRQTVEVRRSTREACRQRGVLKPRGQQPPDAVAALRREPQRQLIVLRVIEKSATVECAEAPVMIPVTQQRLGKALPMQPVRTMREEEIVAHSANGLHWE